MPGRNKGHPVFARYYVRVSQAMETGGMAEYRQQALAGLTGTVIEIGAGNGLNFAHYPAGVTGVLAVEPDPVPAPDRRAAGPPGTGPGGGSRRRRRAAARRGRRVRRGRGHHGAVLRG